MKAGSHQARDMRHIDHQIRTGLIRDLTEPLKINGPAIGACSGDDQLRMGLHRLFLQLVIVDEAFVVDAVRHNIKIQSGKVYGASMGQMAAMVQVHSHYGIPRLQHRNKRRHIGLGARMGLHVGIITAEQLLCPLNGQIFHHIHTFASAVIAFSRIAFRILVGQHCAHRQHNGFGNNVLRRDQLQIPALSGSLRLDGCSHFAVILCDELHNLINHVIASLM